MEMIRNIIRVGNSAGVVLPKDWYGGKARVELIIKPLNIEEDILKILKPYLPNILGVYVVGSYARGEQTSESDVDVIAISKDIKKEIKYGKYAISIYSIDSVKKTMEEDPIMIYPRLLEAKAIINKDLLEELKSFSVKRLNFKRFIEDIERIIKINKKLIELDEDKVSVSPSVIYSLILRIRAIFLIKSMLAKKTYSGNVFKKWLVKEVGGKNIAESAYSVYESIRDNKKIKIKIEIEAAKKMLNLLEKETKRLKDKE